MTWPMLLRLALWLGVLVVALLSAVVVAWVGPCAVESHKRDGLAWPFAIIQSIARHGNRAPRRLWIALHASAYFLHRERVKAWRQTRPQLADTRLECALLWTEAAAGGERPAPQRPAVDITPLLSPGQLAHPLS